MENKKINNNQIKTYLRKIVNKHWSGQLGGVNTSTLAEDACNYFKYPEWINDESNVVWDLSLEIAEEYEQSLYGDLQEEQNGKKHNRSYDDDY
jgi:hypothetical protein